MKTILLAPTPPPNGGIASWTVRMLNTTLKNGWELELVDEKLIKGRSVFGDKKQRNYIYELIRTLSIWRRLIVALKVKENKVVHACIPAGTLSMLREFISAILSKLWRKKFIIHYRCTLPYMINSKIGLFLFRLLTNTSDLAIVLNNASENFIKEYCKTDVVVIPNFIQENELIEYGDKEITEDVNIVLYVGGVIEEKGCKEIVKVAEKFPEIQFRLVGKPSTDILTMDKPYNVNMVGEKSKSEIKQELKNADLFLFVSYFPGEGFSNALLEAMAYGLPCIVSDWAANKDMIENSGGIVVPAKDITSIENAIKMLKTNKALREKQSQWNISKVRREYLDKRVTDMYVDQYERLVNN